MSTNIEIEAKAMINEMDYQTLLANLRIKNVTTYEQINYYFDDEKISHHKIFGLRVRYKNNEYEFTAKIKLVGRIKEINQIISEKEFLMLLNDNVIPCGEVKSYLQETHVDLNEIKFFGKMKTTRSDIKYKTSLISIDKSEYSGITDYEIEAEDNNMEIAVQNLKDFLASYNIVYKENKIGKLSRLIISLSKVKN